MIEQSRRHGHFDPRFHFGAATGNRPKLTLVPALSGSSARGGGAESALLRLVLPVANPDDDDRELGVWENEGGGSVVDSSLRSETSSPRPKDTSLVRGT